MRIERSSGWSSRHGRWAIAIAFVGLNACGFPFAAFGCLIGAAIISATHLHQP